MRLLTLRTKIMVCCVGLVVLLDLIVVVYVRNRLASTLRAEFVAKGRNMAVNLAARSEHSVLTNDFSTLLGLVTDLRRSDEDIVYAYVADRERQVVAHTFTGGFPRDLLDEDGLARTGAPQGGADWSEEPLDTAEAGLVHDIVVPIHAGKVGLVHVGVSEQRIGRTIADFTSAIVLITCVVLLVAGLVAAVASWVVTHPLRELTEAARNIRDGSLGQQVVATTRDEIGDLVESFNQMSDELLKQHKVLDDRNRRIQIARQQTAGERDKLRAIIDSMVEGVVFVDAAGQISLCNESAERIWGVSAGDLLGRPLLDCHPPGMRPKVARILEQAKDKPGFALSRGMVTSQGRCRLSNYTSVHAQDGRYLGLVLLSEDVSEKVRLEQDRKGLRDQLFQQEKMVLIGQIAASVAHELNTPLGTILLRSQLVRHQAGAGGDLSDLNVIESEAQRCRRIIDSLLGFSRRSEGTITETDVNGLIRESLSLIEHDLALKKISLRTDYLPDETTVCMDANQIQQVLLNLVTNAADAMPDGGHVRIETRWVSETNVVEMRVIDDGCGMAQDVLDRAFDPFFTTKERGKGTGLGLAICRRIVEEHEGQIEIESRPGRGTTVSFRLPQATVKVLASE